MNKQETKQEAYKVDVVLTGIKKRCRKVDNHTFKLGYLTYPQDIEQLTDRAQKLANTASQKSMRETQKAILDLTFVEITKSDNGFDSVCWSPFNEKTKALSKKIPLEIAN